MESYVAGIANDLRDSNKKLVIENKALQQEVLKLKEYIKVLESSDYVNELESNIKSLSTALEQERELQQKLKNDVAVLSNRLDEFLAMFASYIGEDSDSEMYLLGDDKSLMFGVNIDSTFLQNASIKAIKNYLYMLKCNVVQHFTIDDFSTTKKSDIVLIGEVFADYVRLSNLSLDINIYGLVEVEMPDIINQHTIVLRFYGNKDIEEDFIRFKQIYSSELRLKSNQ